MHKKKQKIGLALSGGMARCLVYIGVIKALEEQGVEIDYVAGISAGALIGSLFCDGYTGQEIHDLIARQLILKRYLNYKNIRKGLLDSSKIERHISKVYHHKTYKSLPRKFVAVTVDLNTGKEQVFKSGKLAPSVTASMCIPVLMSPVKIRDDYYIDGGFRNYFPIDTVRKMGAERIIIPVIREAKEEKIEKYNAIAAFARSLFLRDDAKKKFELQHETSKHDILISIDASMVSTTNVKDLDKAVEIGYQAARQVLRRKW